MRERIVPAHYLKKLTDTEGLWEVRVEFGGDAFRLLGFFDDSAFILASGFVKKTEHTPPAEIALATERRRDYFRRKGQR